MYSYPLKNNLMTLLIFIFCLQHKRQAKCEIFTAIADIEALLHLEKNFNDFLDHYLKYEERRLQKVKTALDKFQKQPLHKMTNDSQLFLKNPINIFHLVRKMNFNDSELFSLMSRTSLEETTKKFNTGSESFNLPKTQDLQGISLALDRLANTYNIEISSLATGKFVPEAPSVREFSAHDCFEVGRQLYSLNMYQKAIPWAEEALIRIINEKKKSIVKTKILKLLARTTYKTKKEDVISEVKESIMEIDTLHKQKNLPIFEKYFHNIEKYIEKKGIILKDKSFDIIKRFKISKVKVNKLCRYEKLMDLLDEAKLNCYYSTNKSPFLILQPIKVEDAHHQPWIAVFHDILSDKEISTVKRLTIPKLVRAVVGEGTVADFRISKSAWLDDSDHKDITTISKRLAAITGLDMEKGAEDLQVVNYGIGGHYEAHHDFDDSIPLGESTSESQRGKRIATVLIYMSDVVAGGATVFPRLSIAVKPTKGSAVFWYNLFKTGGMDLETEHAACPVLAGSKWVSNKWILEHHQEFRRRCGYFKDDLYEK